MDCHKYFMRGCPDTLTILHPSVHCGRGFGGDIYEERSTRVGLGKPSGPVDDTDDPIHVRR